MLLWQFLFSMIATWVSTCLMSLYQPFMTLWMGEARLLPLFDVSLLCIWFFIDVVQHSFYLYLSGNGLWWEMRWPYLFSTIVNLILNIILGRMFSTTGIIFSTVITSFIFGLVWQCNIIFKVYFNQSTSQFHFRQLIYFIICVISSTFAYLINQLIDCPGLVGLIYRLFTCTVTAVLIMFISYSHTAIFKETKSFLMRVITKQ